MRDFFQAWIAAMALESVVESSTKDVLGMFRQVGPYRGGQIGIRRIGHGSSTCLI